MTTSDYQNPAQRYTDDPFPWVAHYAAVLGWRVLPLWPQGLCAQGLCNSAKCKDPDEAKRITAWGKHPRLNAWSKEASTDLGVLAAHWRPDTDTALNGIGVATGSGSGIIVVDIDPRNGGEETWERVESEVVVPETLRQVTSGGLHLVYRFDPRISSKINFGPGLEVLSNGQQIVVPPTVCGYGRPRTWAPGVVAEMGEELIAYLLRHAVKPPSAGGGGGPGSGGGGGAPFAREEMYADGGRNDAVYRYACSIRQGLRDDQVAVLGASWAWNLNHCVPPLDMDEVKQSVGSALRQARTDLAEEALGFVARTVESGGAPDTSWDPLADKRTAPAEERERTRFMVVEEVGRLLDLTDSGDAYRVLRQRGHDFIHVPGIGAVAWRSSEDRWDVEHGEDSIREAITEAVRREVLLVEMPVLREGSDIQLRTSYTKWMMGAGFNTRIQGAYKTLCRRIGVRPTALDGEGMSIALHNGVLDLTKAGIGRGVRPARREDLMTMRAPATCVDGWRGLRGAREWLDFTRRRWGPQVCPCASGTHPDGRCPLVALADAKARHRQKWAGVFLLGRPREKGFLVEQGPPDNGKSLQARCEAAVLGDLARPADRKLMLSGADREHSTIIYDLRGRRMITISELSPDGRFNDTWLKSWTGGDVQTARRIQGDPVKFPPTGSIIALCNEMPSAVTFDDALIGRLHLMCTDVRLDGGGKNVDEWEELYLGLSTSEEWGAVVLGYMVEGLAMYWEDGGLGVPDFIAAGRANWQLEKDPFQLFLSSCVQVGPGEVEARGATVTQVLRLQQAWAQVVGQEPRKNAQRLTSALERAGVALGPRLSGAARRCGIDLRGSLGGMRLEYPHELWDVLRF